MARYRRNQAEMGQLSLTIQRLRVGGATSDDIMKHLKLKPGTYYYYLAKFGDEWQRTEGAQKEQIVMDFYNARKAEIFELSQMREDAKKANDKPLYLTIHKEVAWLENNLIERMLDMGYVQKAITGPQIAIQNNQVSVALDAFRELNYGASIKSRTAGKVEQSG